MMTGSPAEWCKWLIPLVASCLLGTVAATQPGAGEPVEPGKTPPVNPKPVGASLITPGDAPGLFLLFTGDVIGSLDPCG